MLMQPAASISGRVLVDGQPRAGVSVMAYVLVPLPGESSVYRSQSEQTVSTDVEGKFNVQVSPEQDVRIQISQDGVMAPRTSTYRLQPGETMELPPFELESLQMVVEGVVVDPDGNPVSNVIVSVQGMVTQSVGRGGRRVSSRTYFRGGQPQTTAADGRFRLEQMPNAQVELMAYISPPPDVADRIIHFPARAIAEPGQKDVKIVFDPRLKRSLVIPPEEALEPVRR
jgi:hypothetical protein